MRVEEGGDHRSRSLPGSHTYAGVDSTENECIQFHGVSKRKKQFDDI